jgi:uncharacterized membrane protein YeaQ/YmgE (transglycosylase-associated protein family)
MNPLSWIIFGALAGWAASVVIGNNRRQGCFGNIIVGVIGAFIGGYISNSILGLDIARAAWSWESFASAVGGAALLLFILGARRR